MAEIDELQAADIGVVFVGGYIAEMALMARAAGDRGYPLQLVTGMSLATEEFGLIAGPAAEGALFLDVAEARRRPEAAPVVERFRASGFEPGVSPCTLTVSFRCGRRPPKKPARWSSTR